MPLPQEWRYVGLLNLPHGKKHSEGLGYSQGERTVRPLSDFGARFLPGEGRGRVHCDLDTLLCVLGVASSEKSNLKL